MLKSLRIIGESNIKYNKIFEKKKNMKRLLIYLFVLFFGFDAGMAQQLFTKEAFLYRDSIAVFYPVPFESERMMPSFAIVGELTKKADLPDSWTVRPEYSIQEGKHTITFKVSESVDYYGTGEVVGNLRRNNTEIQLWNTDNYCYTGFEGKQLYQSHPWIMGVREDGSSFGIMIDNTWRQRISLGNPVKIETDGPAPRVVVIEGCTPEAVLKSLGDLTGRIELPPLWALGYHQCRYSYYPQEQVKEIATEFRNRQIPCDVIWMDIDYMDGRKVFTFHPQGFSDPIGTNDYLHSINFKTVYMVDPGIKVDSNYAAYASLHQGGHGVQDASGNEQHGTVWPGNCAFPDFTRPETVQWWIDIYQDFMKNGIDGVWNDMNEPALFNTPIKTMPDSSIHRGGCDLPQDIHLRYHNVYGLLMTRASRQGVMQALPDKRPFVLSRANFLGGHRYSATWTGDNKASWDYLRLSIPMSLNLSLSGQVLNGPDIGGFSGNSNGDLLAHWTAVGVFYPFMRNHAESGTVQQEPWSFGPEVEEVNRTAINRRYRLLPYIYTQMYQASETGIPLMRPAFMLDIKDLSLRKEQEAFAMGSDLLVIPRWSSPALPSGDWDLLRLEDFDDGYQPFVALRSGAIVPMGNVIQSTAEYRLDELTLLVNPKSDGTADGWLYDDSGDGFEYRNGDYALYKLQSKKKGKKLEVTVQLVSGKPQHPVRFRIGYVTDNQITYSPYTTGKSILVDEIKDDKMQLEINTEQMSSTQFPDKDLSGVVQRRGRRSMAN